jgi:hypothetical protein
VHRPLAARSFGVQVQNTHVDRKWAWTIYSKMRMVSVLPLQLSVSHVQKLHGLIPQLYIFPRSECSSCHCYINDHVCITIKTVLYCAKLSLISCFTFHIHKQQPQKCPYQADSTIYASQHKWKKLHRLYPWHGCSSLDFGLGFRAREIIRWNTEVHEGGGRGSTPMCNDRKECDEQLEDQESGQIDLLEGVDDHVG